MAEPFLAEVRIGSFNFAPKGWAMCNGQLLPINQNQGLFSLLGTRYGGNGQTNFALPDMRGRVPIHVGSGHTLGERAGAEAHTLTQAQIPMHTHLASANKNLAVASAPTSGHVLGVSAVDMYRDPTSLVAMEPGIISITGGTNGAGANPHMNMQPFLALTFCIALQGIFPSAT